MSSAVKETTTPEATPSSEISRRFDDLRGVRWRIDLGILPSSSSASVDDLRRVTANSRRRYASLRRQLLVDPHLSKESTSNSLDLVIDNPLSQNPDSLWGRFFKNAELERMLDQDLSRLYPERGSYFQSSTCQGMLRRILLLWCLSHPEYGYKQGMHELLAPLLYVLHVDVERLSHVRKNHDDHFAEKFDDFPFYESNLIYKLDPEKISENERETKKGLNSQPSELDPQTRTIISLSDAYGAEGELGTVISEKFMEHDAYCMFDALMSGSGGSVSMVEFFSSSPSHSGFLPVIEASAALYHLLSLVDSSLHSHLVELGVEPQYFSLRWLRVLFGREFSLENLLIIWDKVFACDNTKSVKDSDSDRESSCGVLDSSRGAFITSFAVSMILYLRSSLLATENGTACLQRLLSFPDDANLAKLITKAKSLQSLAVDANHSSFAYIHPGSYSEKKSVITRGRTHSLSLDLSSLRTVPNVVPDCYWEDKWRNLHKEEEEEEGDKKGGSVEPVSSSRRGWSEKVRLRLSRTESNPSKLKEHDNLKIEELDVKRNLLEDLEQQLGSEKDEDNTACSEDKSHRDHAETNERDVRDQKNSNISYGTAFEESSSSSSNSPISPVHENTDFLHQGPVEASETMNADRFGEESSNSSYRPSPFHGSIDPEKEPESVSVVSDSLCDENDADSCGSNTEFFPPPLSGHSNNNPDSKGKETSDASKKSSPRVEKKIRSAKFQWLWRFGRNTGDGTHARKVVPENTKACNSETIQNCGTDFSSSNGCNISSKTSMEETVNQEPVVNLRSLGQSMLENIQVIESVFQQNQLQTWKSENELENATDGELGKVLSALQELTKISNVLSEM